MLVRNGLISVLGNVVPLLVMIVTLPFILEIIGSVRYGAVSICWLIIVYVGQADFGIGRAVTFWVARLVREDEAAARTMVVSSIVTITVVGLALAGAATLISWIFFANFFDVEAGLRAELMDSLPWIGAATLGTSVLQVLCGALAGRERFVVGSLATMVSNAAMPLFALMAAALFGPSVAIMMIATLVGRILGILIAGSRLWFADLKGHPLVFSADRARVLLQFGFWIMASSFTAPILITVDRMIIGANLGAAAVATYTIPYQIVSRLQVVPQALMNVVFPRLTVGEALQARESAFEYATLISCFFLPIVVGLILLIDPLLKLWLGDLADPQSAPIGHILLSSFLFAAVSQAIAVYLQSREQAKFVATLQLSEILPYALLLGFAAIEFGLIGVALGLLVRRIFETVVFVAKSGFGSFRFWKSQVPALVCLPLALLFDAQLQDLSMRLAAATALALGAFAAAFIACPASLRARVLSLVLRRTI